MRPHLVTLAVLLAILAAVRQRIAASSQSEASQDAVAKLIAQLGVADFRARQEASDQLAKLGPPVLPLLRRAIQAGGDPEVVQRIEGVQRRIETTLLAEEEKLWQELDEPRRSLPETVTRILARTATQSDQQLASTIY